MTRRKILFVRDVRRPTGGNIKVRDYFFHALGHPALDAHVWFPPGSRHGESDIWQELPADRVVQRCDFDDYALVCVNGKDWRLLPQSLTRVVHFVQHGGYADDSELRSFLRRPAHRLCTSTIVRDAILPYANGPSVIVKLGIDDACFDARTIAGTVLILGRKQPAQALALRATLAEHGVEADLLLDGWIPRAEFLRHIAQADILVTLPSPVEGFFLPPLEGMAAGCSVVCSAAIGNEGHCVAGETCLQPPLGDVEAHAMAVLQMLGDAALRARLRRNGLYRAASHRMAAERVGFHKFMSQAIAAP